MYEKILQKLKEQRGQNSQVSDITLSDLARSLEQFIADDDSLAKADFKKAIESTSLNISSIAKKVKEDTENSLKPVGKTAEELEQEELAKKAKEKQDNDTPEWAKQLMSTVEKQNQEIASMKGEKVAQSRLELFEKATANFPSAAKKSLALTFNPNAYSSEEEFNGFIAEVEASNSEFKQMKDERGLNFDLPAVDKNIKPESAVSPEIASAMKFVESKKD